MHEHELICQVVVVISMNLNVNLSCPTYDFYNLYFFLAVMVRVIPNGQGRGMLGLPPFEPSTTIKAFCVSQVDRGIDLAHLFHQPDGELLPPGRQWVSRIRSPVCNPKLFEHQL